MFFFFFGERGIGGREEDDLFHKPAPDLSTGIPTGPFLLFFLCVRWLGAKVSPSME